MAGDLLLYDSGGKTKNKHKIHPHEYEIENRSLCYFIDESAQCLKNVVSLHCSFSFLTLGITV